MTVTEEKKVKVNAGSASSGSPLYGLGVIGAGVYFWRRADTPGDRAKGLAKALVWPAFLVYEAFTVLGGSAEAGD